METTTTETKKKKTRNLYHGGRKERSPHSFKMNIRMAEKVSFSRGTKNTGKFTKKHCAISWTQVKEEQSLNTSQSFPRDLKLKKRRDVNNQSVTVYRKRKIQCNHGVRSGPIKTFHLWKVLLCSDLVLNLVN